MVRVLFWNINKRSLAEPLRQLCEGHDVDILVLAENAMSEVELLPVLNQGSERIFTTPANFSERISFFSRFDSDRFSLVSDTHYCSIHAIRPPLDQEILLAAVHYPSKLRATSEDQSQLMPRIADQIREAESRSRHTRTVLFGDLNMNPFEAGICSAEGLHAVMCKQIAKKGSRTVHRQVITDINGKSLLRNGRPASEFSDHLPVSFTVRT